MKQRYLSQYLLDRCYIADGFIGIFDKEHKNSQGKIEPLTVTLGRYVYTPAESTEIKHREFYPLSCLADGGHCIHDILIDLGYSNDLASYRVGRLLQQAKERRASKCLEIDELCDDEEATIRKIAECAARHPESLIFATSSYRSRTTQKDFAILISPKDSLAGIPVRSNKWWENAGGVHIAENNVVIIYSQQQDAVILRKLGHELMHKFDGDKGINSDFVTQEIFIQAKSDYNKVSGIYYKWRDNKGLSEDEESFIKNWQEEAAKLQPQKQDIFKGKNPGDREYGQALLFHMLERIKYLVNVSDDEAGKQYYSNFEAQKYEVIPLFMEGGREFMHPHRFVQESAGYRLMGLICPDI